MILDRGLSKGKANKTTSLSLSHLQLSLTHSHTLALVDECNRLRVSQELADLVAQFRANRTQSSRVDSPRIRLIFVPLKYT